MTNKKILLAIALLTMIFSLISSPALAQQTVGAAINEQLNPVNQVFGTGQPKPLAQTISEIIKIALGFLGIIFIVLTIYAGFMWMTAAGNDDKIATAKKTLVAAVIGLAIVLSSYAFTRFVIDELLVATGVR